MAISFDNVFFDYVLDPLRDKLISEYNYGKIYIAPNIIHKDPFSIRLWGSSADTETYVAAGWQKQYNIEISLYEIEKNPGEAFFKQFHSDIERIYQLLFTNCKAVTTTIDSTSFTWIDGVCEGYEINAFEEGEEEIDGLNVCRFIFNCKVMRNN
tara:strand:+ start:222 stop:683 length:462 start_codon:yes stop_codon:yes gene_type:complete